VRDTAGAGKLEGILIYFGLKPGCKEEGQGRADFFRCIILDKLEMNPDIFSEKFLRVKRKNAGLNSKRGLIIFSIQYFSLSRSAGRWGTKYRAESIGSRPFFSDGNVKRLIR